MSGLIGSAGSKSGKIGETELDYETGTWTAAFSDGTNALTPHSNAVYNTGFYTKIGNLCHISGYFVTSGIGSASGDLRITGIPFNLSSEVSHGVGSGGGASHGFYHSITSGTSISFYVTTGGVITVRNWDATGGTSALQCSEFGGSGQIVFGFSYRV